MNEEFVNKRRNALKKISLVFAGTAASSSLAFANSSVEKYKLHKIHKNERLLSIIKSVNNSKRYFMIDNEMIFRIDPSIRKFLWSIKYESFVSTTFDGVSNYHTMIDSINGNVTELPALFALVGSWKDEGDENSEERYNKVIEILSKNLKR